MSWSEDVLSGLSAETMKALREFALQQGVSLDPEVVDADIDTNADDDGEREREGEKAEHVEHVGSLLSSLREHFGVRDREEVFRVEYRSKDAARVVTYAVKGVKRELGQTLNSTGLTIWRAAEHLCQYLIDHPERLQGKTVCELGAGLGLVSVLVEKLGVAQSLVVTDGDEDTVKLLIENKIDTDCAFDTSYLYWGEHDDFLSEYPDKFDTLLGADIIYEEEQIVPLIDTACAIMKKSGEFILAFARRNVPMDKVIAVAEAKGLKYEILEETAEGLSMEPIYSFTWK